MLRAIILALSLCSLSFADDPTLDLPAEKPPPPVEAPQTAEKPAEKPVEVKPAEEHPEEDFRAVRIALGVFNFDYAESLPSPLKSTENHVIPAVDVTFVRSNADWFMRGALDLGVGKTTYDGTDQSGNPLVTETQNTFLNSELDVGVVLYHLPNDSAIAAYLGLGAHYWHRELISYLEEYSWLYIPVGVNYAWTLDREWRAGLDIAMKFPCMGIISANFSDFDPSLVNGKGLLGTERTGFRIQLPLSYQPDETSRYSFSVTPWFEYSALSNGPDFPVQNVFHQQVTLAHEPPSRAYRYGAWIGAEIRL